MYNRRTLPNNRYCVYAIWAIMGSLQLPCICDGQVLGPEVSVGGLSQAEWSHEGWRLLLGFPADESPGTGAAPQLGDRGDVFLLDGTGGPHETRSATVRDDQHIFLPLVGLIDFYPKDSPPENEAELRGQFADFMSRPGGLFARVDGTDLAVNFADHAQITPEPGFFDVTFAENNVFGEPAGDYIALSGRFAVMLEPLSQGEHVVEFGGGFDNPDGTEFFRNSVTYNLTVVPEPSTCLMAVTGLLGIFTLRRRSHSYV